MTFDEAEAAYVRMTPAQHTRLIKRMDWCIAAFPSVREGFVEAVRQEVLAIQFNRHPKLENLDE